MRRKLSPLSRLTIEIEKARKSLCSEAEKYFSGKHQNYDEILNLSRQLDQLILQYILADAPSSVTVDTKRESQL